MLEGRIPDWLARWASNAPDAQALRYRERRWSVSELDALVNRTAWQLAALGIRAGSRVALFANNGPAFPAIVYALIRLQAVLLPLNIRLSHEEIRFQLEDARIDYLLVDQELSSQLDGMLVPTHIVTATLDQESEETIEGGSYTHAPAPELSTIIDLNALHCIMYTSGTTGVPKGVLMTYGMHYWNALGSALNLGLHADDRWLLCLPLFHIGGLSLLFRCAIYGHALSIIPRFEAGEVLRAIKEDRITITSGVAVMLQRLLAFTDQPLPAAFRCFLLGGGPAPLPLLEACQARNIPVVQTYGLTESASQAVTLAPQETLRKLGSAGKPLASVQLRVLHEGQEAHPGQVGIIALKGPTITQGYLDRPEETAAAFTEDGWLLTGDLGYLDDEGFLFVLDRRADLIISGGENIYPAQLEATLLRHPEVIEAGVVGDMHPEWGQVPVAYVVRKAESQIEELDLLAFMQAQLARYKVPKRIIFVEMLPRNAAGKLVRRLLRVLDETGAK